MISLLVDAVAGQNHDPRVTLCNQLWSGGKRLAREGVASQGSQRAGARRAARPAREGTVARFTHSHQGEVMATAEETADRRKAHAETRIDSVRDPWAKFLKAAEWLSSELKHQTLRDPKAGAESAQSLYEQTRQFADALNRQSRGGQ